MGHTITSIPSTPSLHSRHDGPVIPRQRILLVDDEPQVLIALEDLLSDRFTVFTARDGQEALNVIGQEPDLAVVMTDQRMPNMTGAQLLSRLGMRSDAIRILVTGFADLNAVIRAVNEGKIFAYVTKPWDEEDLRLKVEKAAEQFRLAKELAYERQLLQDLMNNTPDGIYFKDRQQRFLRVNPSFANWVAGCPPEDLVGKRLEDTGAPQPLVEAEALDEHRVLVEGRTLADIVRELPRRGNSWWLSETIAPIRQADGSVVGLVGISRDITKQRSLESQIAHSQKLEAIGQLAGGVAHDLNNLLAVIGGFSEMVLQTFDPADERCSDLKEVLGATRRSENLVRQLLTFSRRQVIQPKIVNLNDIVANLQKMLNRVIEGSVEIKLVLQPTLGPILADPNQLEQIVINLVINARDAMPSGGTITIETSDVVLGDQASSPAGEHAQFVMLAVTDTGTGMDAETQRHIFEPFFTTKEVGKGTGLGLATVYGIASQNGGHIHVHSELGQGARFEVYFPRAHGAVPKSDRPKDVQQPRSGSETILLVEDNPALKQLTARILRDRGYKVLVADNASAALAILEQENLQIHLLLTDVVMPQASGPMLAAEIRQRVPHIKVLYMSGYLGTIAGRDGSLEPGAEYLQKPFTPNGLAEKIRGILDDERSGGSSK